MTGKKYRFWCLMLRTVGAVRHTFNQDLIRKQESQLKISRRKRKKKGRKKERKKETDPDSNLARDSNLTRART